VAAIDSDPKKIGKTLLCGLTIEPTTKIKELIHALKIEIGVIATPPAVAQRVADLLIDAGVKALLNFAPIQVRVPKDCAIENVDFTVKLEDLAYHLGKTT
jgi:redox-sensing transcriptional repressor